MSQDYELHEGEEVVGTLTFRSGFGTLATADTGDGAWTFKRVGFWQNRVTIRASSSDSDLAVFERDTWASGGSLLMADGRRFNATTSLWRSKLEFRTASDEPLVRFEPDGVFRQSAAVEILPAGLRLAELPLLVTFGWYLVVMLNRDAAVVVM